MKQIILLFTLMLIVCSASAQYNTTSESATAASTGSGLSYSHGTFYLNGQALEKSQLQSTLGSDLYSQYKKGRGLKTAGITCTIVGGAFTTFGLIGVISGINSDSAGETLAEGTIGTVCAIGGAVVLIPGIIMWISGNSRIKKVPLTYNSSRNYAVTLTPASSGAGIAVNF